jgi:hypothetical protein
LSCAAATIAWREATMAKATTLVGLDVHAAKIAAAVLDVENGEVRSYRPPGDVLECGAFCSGLARPARATYEANHGLWAGARA